jgi:hypothetical protein
MARRALLTTLAITVVAASSAAVWYGNRPPRPDLPLPSGFHLVDVQGHCVEGSELFACAAGDRPRSTLTIEGKGSEEALAAEVEAYAVARGWAHVDGWLCRDGQGCLQRESAEHENRLVLEWWATEHTHCARPGSFTLDAVDCGTRPWDAP